MTREAEPTIEPHDIVVWLAGPAQVWRAEVGDDLLGGYATLNHPPRPERPAS